MAFAILSRSSSIKTMSAASIAASEPIAPIAIPISARDNTGASFIPSPTKASLPDATCSSFSTCSTLSPGNSSLYGQPDHLQSAYQKIKVLELLLYLQKIKPVQGCHLAEYPPEQMETVWDIHDWLIQHMDHRITIEELSKRYMINPTTLKMVFKAIYGTSIAAHIKEHRMEQAAKILRESNRSIAEIAQAVGYDSQSKFTAAFKASFQVLPREYRKQTGYDFPTKSMNCLALL